VGVYLLAKMLWGVDLAAVWDAIKAGSVPLFLLALVVGQLPRLTWAASTRAACPKPVPYRAIALLQFAVPFFNLLAPYTAARMAVDIRFFRRQGVPAAAAITIGAIDTLGGFVAQVLVLVAALIFDLGRVNLDFDRPGTGDAESLRRILVIILVITVATVLIGALTPRIRKRVVEGVKPWVSEARQTVASLRSP
jgi:uncharacterized membrane protein YbhN (UPF0104 family)